MKAEAAASGGSSIDDDELIIDLRGEHARVEFRRRSIVLVPAPPPRRVRFLIRAFDVVGAMGAITVLLPVFAVVALAVRLTSRGPVLYHSERIGQDGTTFHAHKFRSMVVDADAQLERILAEADPETLDEYWRTYKLQPDPRLTPIGGLLRRSSLDELPQFFNVLRGEMSLVGPRPKLPEERDRFGVTLPTVLRVKPGITGLWQVNGRSDLGFSERIFLDLDYATNRSFPTDLRICAKTIQQVARPAKNGAY